MNELYPERAVVEVRVNGNIIDIGLAEARAMPPGRRYRYQQQVIYRLSDGAEFVHHISAETKPKLKQAIIDRRKDIEQRLIFASLWQQDDDLTKPPHWHIVWRKTVRLYP
jgi:hypothetical protein